LLLLLVPLVLLLVRSDKEKEEHAVPPGQKDVAPLADEEE